MTAAATTEPLAALSSAITAQAARASRSLVTVRCGRARLSGFVWQPGLIVTAEEGLPDDGEVHVTLPDGSTVTAERAGRDASTDLALLRAATGDAQPAPLVGVLPEAAALLIAVGADSSALGMVARRAGPWRSMRGGEIAARIDLDLRMRPSLEGALAVTATGEAVGMVVSGPRRSALVIPTETIARVAARLRDHGRIARGYLGLGLQPVTVQGEDRRGLIVLNVDPEGPGAAAGLHQGDILVAMDADAVASPRAIQRALGPDSVGRVLTVDIRRGGAAHTIGLTVAERPEG